MAKRDDLWLVTHSVKVEKVKPQNEEWGFAEYLGAAFVIFVVLAIIGAFAK